MPLPHQPMRMSQLFDFITDRPSFEAPLAAGRFDPPKIGAAESAVRAEMSHGVRLDAELPEHL